MKKNILNWMTIVLMAFVCVSFVACGDDDDDAGGGTAQVPSELIGEWYKTSGANSYSMVFKFNANKTGTGLVTHNRIVSIHEMAFTYYYQSNGDVVCTGTRVMTDEDGTETVSMSLTFNYSAGHLVLKSAPNGLWEGAEFTK